MEYLHRIIKVNLFSHAMCSAYLEIKEKLLLKITLVVCNKHENLFQINVFLTNVINIFLENLAEFPLQSILSIKW